MSKEEGALSNTWQGWLDTTSSAIRCIAYLQEVESPIVISPQLVWAAIVSGSSSDILTNFARGSLVGAAFAC